MRPPLRTFVLASLALLSAATLAAQGGQRRAAAAGRTAAGVITEADIRRHLGVIADDSMGGRDTPSRGLERTAAYVADAFRRLNLRPGGDSGTFVQRYRLARLQLDTTSTVTIAGRGVTSHWMMGRDIAPGAPLPPGDSTVSAPVVLLVGMPPDTARPFGDVDVRGTIILHVWPRSLVARGDLLRPLIAKGVAAGARGWMVMLRVQRGFLLPQVQSALVPRYAMVPPVDQGAISVPVLLVRDSSAAPVLRAAGEDPVALRDSTARGVRYLEGFTATLSTRPRVLEETTAPNVVGILEGSDPRLREEYVVFSAHTDHIGATGAGSCLAVGADSVCNGADDDASGTAGVLALAEAFATLQPRPRRSLVFLAVSGNERGLWGSAFYASRQPVPLAQTVAALNLDMIGRNGRDSIAAVGMGHSTLGEVANRASRQHPELRLRVTDGGWPTEEVAGRSDQATFARRGVPSLGFFDGAHPDYHKPTDSSEKIDAEKVAQVVRLVFYIGLDVANAAGRPQWSPGSRGRIVDDSPPSPRRDLREAR